MIPSDRLGLDAEFTKTRFYQVQIIDHESEMIEADEVVAFLSWGRGFVLGLEEGEIAAIIADVGGRHATAGLAPPANLPAEEAGVEVDAAVEALLAAMEPIMIVVLGVVVGGMIVAMYLPIFDMINAVG